MTDFVDEMSKLEQDGIEIECSKTSLLLSCFICDALARAFIKHIKTHNSYYGHEWCTQKGKWVSKVTFPEVDAPGRTDASLDEMADANHHVGPSPLNDCQLAW